jgi:hypothetical protein
LALRKLEIGTADLLIDSCNKRSCTAVLGIDLLRMADRSKDEKVGTGH